MAGEAVLNTTDIAPAKVAMMKKPEVRVYIACSLDGFIAGPDDDLSWLPAESSEGTEDLEPNEDALSIEKFMADVGALLMGRRTYDVVEAMDVAWPYGELPVLVPTHRSLTPIKSTVRAIEGEVTELVALAKEAARGKDVYIDGGELIRQALDADLVDDVVMTIIPTVLGEGHPLFAGVARRHAFRIVGHHAMARGLLQLHMRPTPST